MKTQSFEPVTTEAFTTFQLYAVEKQAGYVGGNGSLSVNPQCVCMCVWRGAYKSGEQKLHSTFL